MSSVHTKGGYALRHAESRSSGEQGRVVVVEATHRQYLVSGTYVSFSEVTGQYTMHNHSMLQNGTGRQKSSKEHAE